MTAAKGKCKHMPLTDYLSISSAEVRLEENERPLCGSDKLGKKGGGHLGTFQDWENARSQA
jgi:hypothetical protein